MSHQTLQYPMDKDKAGRSYWGVIHNTAAVYPDNPTEEQKQNAEFFYKYLIENFVCPDCVNHAREYMAANKPDFSSRLSLSSYFCNMHNEVNKKLGKKIHDCSSLTTKGVSHDNTTCTTCNIKKSGLNDNLEDYKTTLRNTILSVCKEEGLTPPNIHFQPCPDNTSTSCIIYDTTRMKDGVYFGDADIYINPYSASLRTVLHETKHYADLKKGKPLLEVPTDTYAINKINQHFQFDSYKNDIKDNGKLMMDEQVLVAKDNNNENIQLIPIKNDIFGTSNKREVKYDQIALKTFYDYPSLHRINSLYEKGAAYRGKEEINSAEGEVHKNVFVPDNNDDFILSSLNGIFSWPASLVGVSPSTMTMTYVGSMVTNVMMYLIRSNLSTFGTSVFSLFASVSLFTGAAIFKNSIGQGDRGFIQGIVSMFLSAGINNLVPQKREVMSEGLRLFIEGIKSFDLGKIKESMMFDEDAFTMNKAIRPIQEKTQKIANALLGSESGPSIRDLQMASRSNFDARNYSPQTFATGDKNTIPSYANSDLKSVAGAYERTRNIIGGGNSPNATALNNIDLNDLANELNSGIADLDLDADSYEILQM